MNPPDWITAAESLGLASGKLVPFRVFHAIRDLPSGDTVADWHSWLVNERGQLQQFRLDPQKIEEWELLDPSQSENLSRLNQKEEIDYRKRIRWLSLNSLREQRQLWQELQNRAPVTTENLGLILTYPPLVILANEIQEKIADAVQRPAKDIRVAPVKYTKKHFTEVDSLTKKLKIGAAIEQVAAKYGFSVDGFKQQYYQRWYPTKRKSK